MSQSPRLQYNNKEKTTKTSPQRREPSCATPIDEIQITIPNSTVAPSSVDIPLLVPRCRFHLRIVHKATCREWGQLGNLKKACVDIIRYLHYIVVILRPLPSPELDPKHHLVGTMRAGGLNIDSKIYKSRYIFLWLKIRARKGIKPKGTILKIRFGCAMILRYTRLSVYWGWKCGHDILFMPPSALGKRWDTRRDMTWSWIFPASWQLLRTLS